MAPEDILFMLQECNPHLPTKDWKVVKVEEHEGDVNQAVLVLNKESVAKIKTVRGLLNFGFSAIHIKVYKGDSNACILAKRHFGIYLLRNYNNGDNTAVSLELQSGSIRVQ